MKPEFILQADLLEILFENRNKEYGAYELRKQYNHRLKKSLAFVFLALFSLYGILYIETHFFKDASAVQVCHLPIIPETTLTRIVDLKQEIIPKEKPRPEKRIENDPQIGYVNGLAVYGPNMGTVIEVEATAIETDKGNGTLNITGIIEEEETGGYGRKYRRKSNCFPEHCSFTGCKIRNNVQAPRLTTAEGAAGTGTSAS